MSNVANYLVSLARLTGEFSKGIVVLSTGDTTLCGCISAYYSRSRPLKSKFLWNAGMLAYGPSLVKLTQTIGI